MGLFKSIGNLASGIGKAASAALPSVGGHNLLDVGLSSLPFVGEAFSASSANKFTAEQNQAAMSFEAQQAHANRRFQERMSNSAFQRQMADMGKAGLNPMLAAGMSGSSTPGGAMASGKAGSGAKANPNTTEYKKSVQLQNAALKRTDQKLKAEKELLSAQSAKASRETEIMEADLERSKSVKEWYQKNPNAAKIERILSIFGPGISSAAQGAAIYGGLKGARKSKAKTTKRKGGLRGGKSKIKLSPLD